jgi:RNA polymerase sigma-70 factor (ECF subfamily)
MLKQGRSGVGIPDGKTESQETTEQRLIGLIVKEDLRAFETLYRTYFPRLTRFLDRMTRTPHLIEEIINDTMMVVWQKANQYDGSCKVSTWIFAIAYRKALNVIRSLELPIESDSDEYPALNEHEPEHALENQQLRKIFTQALDTLPIEQRNVVNLAYYHDMAYGEIAEIMACPVNTVKTRMFHARRQLKVLLSAHLEVQG